MSVLAHYDQITRGVVGLPSLIFFISIIVFALVGNTIAIEQKKAS
jgi:ABC-2 type transport system permease protein